MKKHLGVWFILLIVSSTLSMEQNDLAIVMSDEHAISMNELVLKSVCKVQNSAQLCRIMRNKITSLASLSDDEILQKIRSLDGDGCNHLKNILIKKNQPPAGQLAAVPALFDIEQQVVMIQDDEVSIGRCDCNPTRWCEDDHCWCCRVNPNSTCWRMISCRGNPFCHPRGFDTSSCTIVSAFFLILSAMVLAGFLWQ